MTSSRALSALLRFGQWTLCLFWASYLRILFSRYFSVLFPSCFVFQGICVKVSILFASEAFWPRHLFWLSGRGIVESDCWAHFQLLVTFEGTLLSGFPCPGLLCFWSIFPYYHLAVSRHSSDTKFYIFSLASLACYLWLRSFMSAWSQSPDGKWPLLPTTQHCGVARSSSP